MHLNKANLLDLDMSIVGAIVSAAKMQGSFVCTLRKIKGNTWPSILIAY